MSDRSYTRAASDYADVLLRQWSRRATPTEHSPDPHPARAWARSGAMSLTGPPERPVLAPAALAACARGALQALRSVAVPSTATRHLTLDAPALLGERAAILGLARNGRTAPGGSCRLLPARDGWIAVNLAREDDRALVAAWLGEPAGADDAFGDVARQLARRDVADVVERGRLLGLPVASARADATRRSWCETERIRPAAPPPPPTARPLVVDLSSLWAGPLAGHLLALAGARVVKLESLARPDGARAGPPAFFDLMNAGKACVALDFASDRGRHQLAALLETADIVIEASRPRALEQLGVSAAHWLASLPGRTWLSITGYGRRAPEREWVAFGDDAAVAAGLATRTGGSALSPLFCGDAIADPLTGLHGAVAALASWKAGGGELLDVPLCGVAAHALDFAPDRTDASVERDAAGWRVVTEEGSEPVVAPRARQAARAARPLGADTKTLFAEHTIPC